MSLSHAKSHPARQRPSRNWIADTLVVAGVLVFGYFAIAMETARQQAQGPSIAEQTTVQSPLELLR